MEQFDYLFADLSPDEIKTRFKKVINDKLTHKYGENPDKILLKRVKDEWQAMERTDSVFDMVFLYELIMWYRKTKLPCQIRGNIGSSFISYLLGITFGNPLPPHYYCPKCHRIHWMFNSVDGFDLPSQKCASDQELMITDGHDIPCQMLWGFKEDFVITDVLIERTAFEALPSILDKHWMHDLGIVKNKVKVSPPDKSKSYSNIKFSRINFIYSAETFLNDQHLREKFQDFYDKKVDSSCTAICWQKYKDMHDPYINEKNFKAFKLKGHTFADLVALAGIAAASYNSEHAWEKELLFMNHHLGYAPSELISHRDDIYRYLISHGFSEEDAWKGTRAVWLGQGLPKITEEMKHARDKWVLDCCEHTMLYFPKAATVEFFMFQLKAYWL